MTTAEVEKLVESKPVEAMSSELKQRLRNRAKVDLYFFAKAVLGFDLLVPHIHMPLCVILEDFENNIRIRLVLPRGWFKSTIVSIAYPIWRSLSEPSIRVLITQNTFTNAAKKLAKIKGLFEGRKLFRTLFPDLLPTKHSTWKTDALEVNREVKTEEATFEAAGIRTQVTSRHYDLIVEDDTVAPELDEVGEQNLAPTKDDIDQAIGWHRLATPLLISPGESQIIVVGTRWFEIDLLSWIGDNEKHYKSYVRASRENSKGEADENGEVVYPERFGVKVLNELRVALGPYMYSCLYMNLPVRSSDMLFKLEWFKYYDTEPQGLVNYTTVDPAGNPEDTKTKENDFNVVVTCGKDLVTGRVYVLDYNKERCNPGALINMIFAHVRKWDPVVVGVEGNAFQHTMLYWLRERMRKEKLFFMTDNIQSVGAKSSGLRIPALQPLIESGMLVFRKWMVEMVQQGLTYPYSGGKVDLIDCLAFQLRYWQQTRSEAEARKHKTYDPMSLDAMIAEVEKRYAGGQGVLDVLGPSPDVLNKFSLNTVSAWDDDPSSLAS